MANVKMYGTAYCPYCLRARALLEQEGVVYEYVPVDGDQELRAEMERLSGGRTVPQIFIDEQPIGGCDELHALHRSGELIKRLGR